MAELGRVFPSCYHFSGLFYRARIYVGPLCQRLSPIQRSRRTLKQPYVGARRVRKMYNHKVRRGEKSRRGSRGRRLMENKQM